MSAHVVRLRPMEDRDLAAVVALESASQYTPWTAANFRDALKAGNLCLVIEDAEGVSGYGVLQMAAADAELLSMAVAPDKRRRGVGRRLLDELVARAIDFKADSVWLEVRVSNRPAIGLYGSAGFAEIGRRKGYYQTVGGREDALMMRLALGLLEGRD